MVTSEEWDFGRQGSIGTFIFIFLCYLFQPAFITLIMGKKHGTKKDS